jgi:hypothetical protein
VIARTRLNVTLYVLVQYIVCLVEKSGSWELGDFLCLFVLEAKVYSCKVTLFWMCVRAVLEKYFGCSLDSLLMNTFIVTNSKFVCNLTLFGEIRSRSALLQRFECFSRRRLGYFWETNVIVKCKSVNCSTVLIEDCNFNLLWNSYWHFGVHGMGMWQHVTWYGHVKCVTACRLVWPCYVCDSMSLGMAMLRVWQHVAWYGHVKCVTACRLVWPCYVCDSMSLGMAMLRVWQHVAWYGHVTYVAFVLTQRLPAVFLQDIRISEPAER